MTFHPTLELEVFVGEGHLDVRAGASFIAGKLGRKEYIFWNRSDEHAARLLGKVQVEWYCAHELVPRVVFQKALLFATCRSRLGRIHELVKREKLGIRCVRGCHFSECFGWHGVSGDGGRMRRANLSERVFIYERFCGCS